LPTYNRADFLPQAIQSIRDQQFTNWELIIVDDGSTDETRNIIPGLTAGIEQPIKFIRQENQGAYGARNTGLDHASGRLIAFFDSDDHWLPHHLKDCAEALDANPDVDWVYGACRVVLHATGEVRAESSFYVNGKPRPFLSLKCRAMGRLRIINDATATRCMILNGLFCGLQNSVIRRRVFESMRFEWRARNEAEDQLVVIRSLLSGYRFAYLDSVHVIYRIHEANSSASAENGRIERRTAIQRSLLDGYEGLARELTLSRRERQALRRRLAREYFWLLGYALQWQHGRRHEALASFRRGIAYAPWNLAYWKTYVGALARTCFGWVKFQPSAVQPQNGVPMANRCSESKVTLPR
jgi:glycosyltransferase involved in cell wall biosynthesis